MEELKFRALDTITNTMHNTIEELCFENGILIEVIFKKSGDGIGSCADEIVDWQHADKTILMQYTGKKDNKGIEIYDGDVLRWYPNKPVNHIDVIIGWNEYTASFYFGDWYDNDFPDTAIDSLVIGNIYQKP